MVPLIINVFICKLSGYVVFGYSNGMLCGSIGALLSKTKNKHFFCVVVMKLFRYRARHWALCFCLSLEQAGT